MSALWNLYRRRRLAYELLAEYDRPKIDMQTALRQIEAYAASGDWAACQITTQAWADAVRAKAKRYG